ncbi:D-sedoheptulose-7-phosphate isomerase [Sphingomonas glacialis]|uniref:Phosphoheptose isomerase n=1 Tax=Sphingomonas glacialis TaxID=658225 RepID=A0A502FRH0_9SPHN|nr:SIS domain-containing protein [Sphingomonas glacialis]TPG51623.1 SIS domain-containing protein [Sphingomonas glacialis]
MATVSSGSPIAVEIAGTIASLQTAFTPEYCSAIDRAAEALTEVLRHGGKVLIMGNGGSAADAQHIAAELVGRYKVKRKALAAIALTTDSSILTAWSNDYNYDTVFSRQVEALARPGDIVWGISTSGNSRNVVAAFESARAIGATTLGMLGRDGGRLLPLSDVAMVVPLAATDQIQAAHLLTYHALCSHLDTEFQ